MLKKDKVKFVDCDAKLCFHGPGVVEFETKYCQKCKHNKNRNETEDNYYTAGRI